MSGIIIFKFCYMFIIAICLASFCGVIADRLPKRIKLSDDRSRCSICYHRLAWYDLFPIASYLFLKGKCRYCHSKIDLKYFLLELIGAFIGVFSFLYYGFTFEAFIIIIISLFLVTISFIDLEIMIIPDELNISILICSLIMMIIRNIHIVDAIIGMLIIALPMYLINIIVKNSFGGGDIKLMLVSGLGLGWANNILATFIAVLTCGIYASFLILFKKINIKSHLAFGPFLALGIFIALNYGKIIIDWYTKIF